MATSFEVLLDATIDHLQRLKAGGVRHVSISPEALESLTLSAAPSGAARRATSPKAPSLPPARLPAASLPDQATLTPAPVSTPAQVNPGPPAVEPEFIAPVENSKPTLTAPPSPQSKADYPAFPPVSNPERETAMAELRARAMVCQKCPHLASARQNVVFGVGDIYSPLMFVGEAPGADEDAQGEPFVGEAGQLLTKIIHAMGFRRETVYIANVLKCRPDMPGRPSGNRKPTSEEMKTCLPYLLEQIELIQPKVIVALGAIAVDGLLGIPTGISKLRGNFQSLRGIPVMPTYHPAYLLHNQARSEKRKVWEDMLQVLEKLGRPITKKERSFFSRSG